MNDLVNAITNLIPPTYRPLALAIMVLLPRGFFAWSNGGNLKAILSAMFLGTNTPAPAAPSAPVSTAQSNRLGIPLMSLMLLGCLALSAPGCASQGKAAFTASSATQVTVDTAMTAWGDYVKQYGATVHKRAKVKALYIRYQNTIVNVIDAEEVLTALSTTNSPQGTLKTAQDRQTAALAASSQALLDLVATLQSFGVKL